MYWMEIHGAAKKVMEELVKVKPGEVVAVTMDTESDADVANAMAGAAEAVGGKPFVFSNPAARGVGKAGDPDLPLDALTPALANSDVWIELNNQWLLYSSAFEGAMEAARVRHLCLVGMDADMLVRTIGRVDIAKYQALWGKLAELTESCTEMTITTPAGTDLEFKMHPETYSKVNSGIAEEPGAHFLGGQISWVPDLDTIQGTLVFDGSIDPPCRLVDEPVAMKIEKGRVIHIDGGSSAAEFEQWLKSFDDDRMFRLVHACYGMNPGAKLTGNILEDERVWGCTEWGLGYYSPHPVIPEGNPAPSHTDGICLNSTVKGDVGTILQEGVVVHPELLEIMED